MFSNVSGPTEAELAAAASELGNEAVKRGGKVLVTREHTPEGEKRWVLMNQAAEWLAKDGHAQFGNRGTESFELGINC